MIPTQKRRKDISLKQIINRQSLLFRMVLTVFTVTSSLLLVLGVVMYTVSKRTIEAEYQNNHAYNMELFSYSLQIELNDIINQSRNLLSNDQYYYVMMSEDSGNNYYFSTAKQQTLNKILNSFEDENKYVRGTLVVSPKGKAFYTTKFSYSYELMNEFYRNGTVMEQPWIKSADEANGREVFFGYNVLDSKSVDSFSVVKRMNRIHSMEFMGYEVVCLSKAMLKEIIGQHTDSFSQSQYMVLDDDNIVYSSVNTDILDEVLEEYRKQSQKRYLFTTFHERNTGWTIVGLIDKKELSSRSDYIRLSMIVGIIALILLCIPLALIISSQMYRPLRLLENTIREIGAGNYKPDVRFNDGEVGRVGKYLLEISANNLALREELLQSELNEQQARLLLLQSQIDPHFLYNTLDAIYLMAVIRDADDIAEMVQCLSDMFRLSLNRGDLLISLGDEMKKIESYVKIMNFRFDNKFDFSVDIEEELLGEKILTFIIQPIVENAITHGLENKIEKGQVSVVGYRDGEFMKILISDNGVGMEDLTNLENGYGIRNVKERMRLFYGEEAGLSFESVPGEGTIAYYQLPFWRGEIEETDRN